MKLTVRLGAATLLAAALGACDKAETTTAADAKAGGQILERSVTDDMIAYDTLRSQAPLARPSDGDEAGDNGDATAGDEDVRQDAE